MAADKALSPRISVVVVAHDSGADLLRCVESVLHSPMALEVIVVDNASSDGSLAKLPPDPRVRLLLNPHNRGFARACNQGAELARAETLLFLNPDCVLPEDAIAVLELALHSDQSIGVLGAQLLDSDGSPQSASHRAAPSPLLAVRVALGLDEHGKHERSWREGAAHTHPADERPPAQENPPVVVTVDAISGALMMLRSHLFRTLGGFDEGYVLHCEDLDLCRRIRAQGASVGYVPSVRVTHHKGTSSKRRPVWVEWQKHRGMWRYFRKHDASATPLLAQPLLFVGLWARFGIVALRAWLRSAGVIR